MNYREGYLTSLSEHYIIHAYIVYILHVCIKKKLTNYIKLRDICEKLQLSSRLSWLLARFSDFARCGEFRAGGLKSGKIN